MIVAIGNGLYAHTKDTKERLSLREWSRRLQATCEHKQRDPRGQCYRCGQKSTSSQKESGI